MEKFKQNLVNFFELAPNMPAWQKRIERGLYLLILLSSLGVLLESFVNVRSNPVLLNALYLFEDFAMLVFSIEVLLCLLIIDRLHRNCQTAWERFMLYFYLLIDIAAVLPAIIFVFLGEHHDYFLTLRLLRIFKVFRHDDSVELVLRAVAIKKDVLLKTALIIFIMTAFLAVLLYEAENQFEFGEKKPEESTQFVDIYSSLIWCSSMFVGDLAGYIESGFMPTTPVGRFVAGVLGFLNIAILVIPTGIIASGFLEVLEEKKIERQHNTLKKAFRPKYNDYLKRAVFERPRTMLTLQNTLYIHENNLFRILESKPGFRLRAVQSDDREKYGDLNLVEFFGYGELTSYGVRRGEQNCQQLFICPDALAKQGIGYAAYIISDLLDAQLISNELFEAEALNPNADGNLLHNSQYFEEITLPTKTRLLKKIPNVEIALHDFKADIRNARASRGIFVVLSDEEVAKFSIERDAEVRNSPNDLWTWLAQTQAETPRYLLRINQKALNHYQFYELLQEVAQAIEKEDFLN